MRTSTDEHLPDELVKRLAEVVYTGLRKSAADLSAEFALNRWMNEIDAKLLEGREDPAGGITPGVFSEILEEVERGADIGFENVGDTREEIWVIEVRSRQLEFFRARQKKNFGKSVGRLELGPTQIGGKKYTVRIVPANHAEYPPQDHLHEKVVLRP